MTFDAELELLIRARYPVIYIQTGEELRLQGVVAAIAARRQKKAFEWSCSAGILPLGGNLQAQKGRNAATRDPLAALDQIMEQVEPALFVLKDFHPFLTRNNYIIIRKLKDIAIHLKNSFKTVLIVSPVLEIPVELEKEIAVLSFPLPRKPELGELLDGIVGDLAGDQVQIDVDAQGRDHLLQAALGLTLTEAENAFAKIIVQTHRLGVEHVGDILAEKQQIVKKGGLLEYYPAKEGFAAIGGLEALKDWLAKRALAFTDDARAFGLPPPRGVLLLGVQGCGKSLCAKAIAAHWQLPLLRFDVGRMFGSLVGSSEENVRRAVATAEAVAPAILWIDEIDKAFAGTHSSGAADSGTAARVFGTFLTWLSEKTAPVFVVATANDVTNLPPELLRKGRLDEIFFVDLPSADERREIFRVHLEKRGRSPAEFDLHGLALAAAEFSGAEIEESINSGLYEAFSNREALATSHVLAAINQSVPMSRTMDAEIGHLRVWARGRARPAGARVLPQ